jgi:hypothetical protein
MPNRQRSGWRKTVFSKWSEELFYRLKTQWQFANFSEYWYHRPTANAPSRLCIVRICRMDDSASNPSLPEWATGVLWCPSTTLIVAIYWCSEKHSECGTGLWSHIFVVFWSYFERYIDENTSLQIFDGYIAFIILTTTIFWNPLLRSSSLDTPRFSAQLHPGLYRSQGCSAQSRYHKTIAWNTSFGCVLSSQFSVPGTCSDSYCKHSTLACRSTCSITCAVAFWVVAEHKAVSRAETALATRRFICIILGCSYEYQVPGASTLYSYFRLPTLRVNSWGKTELWLWIGCVCIIAVRNSCLRQFFGNGTKWIIALWLELRVS